MSIAEQTLATLEFHKIREQLARYVSFSASRELALTLLPGVDSDDIQHRLALTTEARRLLDERPEATIGGARDVREAVQHALRGGVLEASLFVEIGNTLRSIRRLRGILLHLDSTDFPRMTELGADLPQKPELEQEIERTISEDGLVLDSASPRLGRLRKEIQIAASRLQDRMHGIVTSSQYASVLQEPIVTVRNGRYVVPVKAAQRRAIPGLVHDQSASGATLYVEPLAMVELNNHLREAQLAEEEEVRRILAGLSERVGSVGQEIITGVDTLALLDLYFAQARYALALRCVAPELADMSGSAPQPGGREHAPLLLTAARHPLLDQSKVVPIDIWLGPEFRLLLITGPNTGGKTVALKTVGLLALMAQAGLHIPASYPARLPIFGQIFADIGDEQSIEQSLSTFSSHMTHIIQILETIEQSQHDDDDASQAMLVLLDELGAGTDPVEGTALARAISERLLERECLAICTTHYAELKAFAHSTPGVQNASVEFDVDTLAPTYRLTIGLPGRSNALAIAARLGLDPALVERARGAITSEELQLEGLLATIHHEREAAAAALARAEELRSDAEKYRDRYARMLQELEDSMQTRLDEATHTLEQELQSIRGELRRLRDDSRSATLSRQWLQEAEQRLQEMPTQLQARGQKVIAASPAGARRERTPKDAPRAPKAGDTVLVRSVGLKGEILAIDEEEQTADVQVGGFRMHVALHELQREKRSDESEPRSSAVPPRTVSLPAMPEVSIDFDMRGWRVADVADRLDRYLNDAYLAGLPYVRLIHGKGSGALRQVVRDILQRHSLVSSFGGGGSEGGEGVTVARLKEQ